MVAVQVLLMNYFLLGLHSDNHLTNEVLPPLSPAECSLGCKLCSEYNGCLSCKPPYVLVLPSETITQWATCKRDCPKGYFNSYSGSSGFCISKIQMKECKRCTYRTHCLPCRRGKYKGKCHRKCSQGPYFDAICNTCLQQYHPSGPNLSFGESRNWTWSRSSLETAKDTTSNQVSKPLTKEEKKQLKAKRRNRKRRKRKRKKKRKGRHKKGRRGRKRDRKRHRIRHWKRRKRKRKNDLLKNSNYNYTSKILHK